MPIYNHFYSRGYSIEKSNDGKHRPPSSFSLGSGYSTVGCSEGLRNSIIDLLESSSFMDFSAGGDFSVKSLYMYPRFSESKGQRFALLGQATTHSENFSDSRPSYFAHNMVIGLGDLKKLLASRSPEVMLAQMFKEEYTNDPDKAGAKALAYQKCIDKPFESGECARNITKEDVFQKIHISEDLARLIISVLAKPNSHCVVCLGDSYSSTDAPARTVLKALYRWLPQKVLQNMGYITCLNGSKAHKTCNLIFCNTKELREMQTNGLGDIRANKITFVHADASFTSSQLESQAGFNSDDVEYINWLARCISGKYTAEDEVLRSNLDQQELEIDQRSVPFALISKIFKLIVCQRVHDITPSEASSRAVGIAAFALLRIAATYVADSVDKLLPIITREINSTILGGNVDALIIDIDNRFPGMLNKLSTYLSHDVNEYISDTRIYKSSLSTLWAMCNQDTAKGNIPRIVEGARIKYRENSYDKSELALGYKIGLFALSKSDSVEINNNCKDLFRKTFDICRETGTTVFGEVNSVERWLEALLALSMAYGKVSVGDCDRIFKDIVATTKNTFNNAIHRLLHNTRTIPCTTQTVPLLKVILTYICRLCVENNYETQSLVLFCDKLTPRAKYAEVWQSVVSLSAQLFITSHDETRVHMITRGSGLRGEVFNVSEDTKLTLDNVIVDGGAKWTQCTPVFTPPKAEVSVLAKLSEDYLQEEANELFIDVVITNNSSSDLTDLAVKLSYDCNIINVVEVDSDGDAAFDTVLFDSDRDTYTTNIENIEDGHIIFVSSAKSEDEVIRPNSNICLRLFFDVSLPSQAKINTGINVEVLYAQCKEIKTEDESSDMNIAQNTQTSSTDVLDAEEADSETVEEVVLKEFMLPNNPEVCALTVSRQADTRLGLLKIIVDGEEKNFEEEFESNQTLYSVKVPYDVDSLEFMYEQVDPNSVVKIENSNPILRVGDNFFDVVTENGSKEDGTYNEMVYSIVVYREAKVAAPENPVVNGMVNVGLSSDMPLVLNNGTFLLGAASGLQNNDMQESTQQAAALLNYGSASIGGYIANNTISAQTDADNAGGIMNYGSLDLLECSYVGENCSYSIVTQGAGGIVNAESGIATIFNDVSVCANSAYGPGAILNKGQLNVFGAAICRNKSNSEKGVGGIQNCGSFLLSDAIIEENSCDSSGGIGGIYNFGDGEITISGNTAVCRNHSTSVGGILNTGKMNLTGGRVSENYCTDEMGVGGVKSIGRNGFTISGSLVITSNAFSTNGDILPEHFSNFYSESPIIIESALENSMIGISCDELGSSTVIAKVNSEALTNRDLQEYADYFYPDKEESSSIAAEYRKNEIAFSGIDSVTKYNIVTAEQNNPYCTLSYEGVRRVGVDQELIYTLYITPEFIGIYQLSDVILTYTDGSIESIKDKAVESEEIVGKIQFPVSGAKGDVAIRVEFQMCEYSVSINNDDSYGGFRLFINDAPVDGQKVDHLSAGAFIKFELYPRDPQLLKCIIINEKMYSPTEFPSENGIWTCVIGALREDYAITVSYNE